MTAPADFPDWISPMLVKELRQGMRARAFLISFLALQGALILLTVISLSNSKAGEDTTAATVFYWLIICIPLLLVMPFSGLNAISSERKENTLELIFLSRLSPRRIAAGKWLAIVAQSALLVSAILPYAVLRYYMGGVDLIANLEALGWLLLGSAALTSVTIAVSSGQSVVRRGFSIIAFVMILFWLFGLLSSGAFGFALFSSGGGSGIPIWRQLTACFLLAALFLFSMIEFAAGKLAPDAVNHSSSRRLAAFAVLLVCCCYTTLLPGVWWLWLGSAFILIPTCIGAVCEPVRDVPSVYRPFQRFGFPGRVLAMPLYPGWPGGVLFLLIALGVVFLAPHGPFSGLSGAAGRHARLGDSVRLRVMIATAGSFLLPAAVLRLPRVRSLPPAVFFISFQGACGLVAALTSSLAGESGTDGEPLAASIPFCHLLMSGNMASWPKSSVAFSASGEAAATAASILALFIMMIPEWRKIFAMQRAFKRDASKPV